MSKPLNQKRWTLAEAAPEFDIDPDTLSGRVKQRNILPGDDDRFSTKQICEAVWGDLEQARLKKLQHEGNILAIEEARARGEVIEIATVAQVWSNHILFARRVIISSGLLPAEQDAILNELESFKVADLDAEAAS